MNETLADSLAAHDAKIRAHIRVVRENLGKLIGELDKRACEHDASKLESPEREVYAEALPDLSKTVYGTSEYYDLLNKVKPATDHHYAKNRHHPEHHSNGVDDMDLVDLLEMIADWAAATKMNKNGNVHRSIEINTPRFKLTPQLARILTNTVNRYF